MFKLFISYSHKDKIEKDRLYAFLKLLAEERNFSIWTDDDLSPGEEWDPAIMKHLESSQIILVLLSVDFLNSDFIRTKEMRSALDLHRSDEAIIIPVIVRPIPEDHPFKHIQALPPPEPNASNENNRAMSLWPDLDLACLAVRKGIATAIEKNSKILLRNIHRCHIDYRIKEIEALILEGEISKAGNYLMQFCSDFSPNNLSIKIKATSIKGTYEALKKNSRDSWQEINTTILNMLTLLEEVRTEPLKKAI